MSDERLMKISPRFTADDWSHLDPTRENDWPRALEIFRDRIEGRFLRPMRSFLSEKSSGFAILALDSLLVETLQQFWEGVPKTPSKVSSKGCRQLQSEAYFRAFLRGPLYKGGFSRQTAGLFYRTIRCGILHQAEAEGSSRVLRRGVLVVLRSDKRGIDVNRVKFHQELERAIDRYLVMLADNTETVRRHNFWKKMNYIARKKASAVEAG